MSWSEDCHWYRDYVNQHMVTTFQSDEDMWHTEVRYLSKHGRWVHLDVVEKHSEFEALQVHLRKIVRFEQAWQLRAAMVHEQLGAA